MSRSSSLASYRPPVESWTMRSGHLASRVSLDLPELFYIMRILPGHTVPHMDMDDGGAGLIDRDGVVDDLIHSDGRAEISPCWGRSPSGAQVIITFFILVFPSKKALD